MTALRLQGLVLVSSLMLAVSGFTFAQSAPPEKDIPPAPTRPTQPIPKTPVRGTDSSQIPRGITQPSTGAQQIISKVAAPCNYNFQDIDTWTRNLANQCGPNNSKSLCFVQLRVNPVINTLVSNSLSCPRFYAPVSSFGIAVQNAQDPTQRLVYTPYDVKAYPITRVQRDYYTLASYNNGYTCGPLLTTGGISYEEISISSSTTGIPLYPQPRYNLNTDVELVGNLVRININPSVVVEECQINDGAGWLSNQAPNTCRTPPIIGRQLRWVVTYHYTGAPIQCTRPAGFYPEVENPQFPLATPTSTYSPTILICGKVSTAWAPSSDPSPERTDCVNLP